MCEGPKCMEGRESFLFEFFFKPLYHKSFLCKFFVKFNFSSMEYYSMLKCKQGKQGEKEVYELRTFVYKLLCKFKSKSRELCEDEFC